MQIVTRADAKSRGDSYYFTGKPCVRGHVAQRKVNGCHCVECRAEITAKWAEDNREKVRKARSAYKSRNPDKRRQEWREWAAKYPEKIKEWKANNRDKLTSMAAKRRASKLNATPSWLNAAEKAEIEGIYQFAKIMSLIGGRPYEVDHIEPLQGKTVCGLHVPWNLQVIERSENRQKSNRLTQDLHNGP